MKLCSIQIHKNYQYILQRNYNNKLSNPNKYLENVVLKDLDNKHFLGIRPTICKRLNWKESTEMLSSQLLSSLYLVKLIS